MENKNTVLKVTIIILSVLVVSLSIYIAYDRLLRNNDTKEENNSVNLDTNASKEEALIEEIKEIFEFVYKYIELPEVYCGEKEIITDINDEMHMYHLSTEYSTYNEMLNDLKKYMSIEVISSGRFASTNNNYYIEKTGKMYCEEMYKGYPYGHGNIDIKIISLAENKIVCVATMELTDMSNNKTYDEVNLTLEKDNNNWLITSYEKQN